MILRGMAVSPGIAIGPAIVWSEGTLADASSQITADQIEGERARLKEAVTLVEADLSALQARVAETTGPEEAAIFEAQQMMLRDPAFLGEAVRQIESTRLKAEAALTHAATSAAAALEALADDRFRARAADVRDIAMRVVRKLAGQPEPTLPGPSVVVALDLAPSQVAALGREHILGIATVTGGPTAHVAILARAMGVPAVVGLRDVARHVTEGATLVVDGDRGEVVIDPPRAALEGYTRSQRAAEAAKARAGRERDTPAITRDGRKVEVAGNAGTLGEIAAAMAAGADGIGLLRTEFLFLGRRAVPDEEEQFSAYQDAVALLKGHPLIIRTADIGADKPLPFLRLPAEANPALGYRGIRIGLDHPELLMPQLLAALRASAYGPVKIMFPMVATLEEVERAMVFVEEARRTLGARHVLFDQAMEIGVMIEVPSAALLAEELAAEVHFMSLGTNDLIQYVFAADRTNERVVGLSQSLHPALLRLIAPIVRAAHARHRWVGVCGEMAGDPVAAVVLVGLGVDELSMAPPAIAPVKAAIHSLEFRDAEDAAWRALRASTASDVQAIAESLLERRPA